MPKEITRSITFKVPLDKLNGPDGKPVKKAKLIMVKIVHIDDFATSYAFNDYHDHLGPRLRYSELYVMLVFLKPGYNTFIEMRPYHPRDTGDKMSNEEYYKTQLDREMEIKIL